MVDEPSVFGLKWLLKPLYPPLGAAMVAFGVYVPLSGGEIGSSFFDEVAETMWPLFIGAGAWIAVFGARNLFSRRPVELGNGRLILRYELNHVRPHVISRSDVDYVHVSTKAIDFHGGDRLLARVAKFALADPAGFESELRARWRDVRFVDGQGLRQEPG